MRGCHAHRASRTRRSCHRHGAASTGCARLPRSQSSSAAHAPERRFPDAASSGWLRGRCARRCRHRRRPRRARRAHRTRARPCPPGCAGCDLVRPASAPSVVRSPHPQFARAPGRRRLSARAWPTHPPAHRGDRRDTHRPLHPRSGGHASLRARPAIRRPRPHRRWSPAAPRPGRLRRAHAAPKRTPTHAPAAAPRRTSATSTANEPPTQAMPASACLHRRAAPGHADWATAVPQRRADSSRRPPACRTPRSRCATHRAHRRTATVRTRHRRRIDRRASSHRRNRAPATHPNNATQRRRPPPVAPRPALRPAPTDGTTSPARPRPRHSRPAIPACGSVAIACLSP